jgi:hypothetical protein
VLSLVDTKEPKRENVIVGLIDVLHRLHYTRKIAGRAWRAGWNFSATIGN